MLPAILLLLCALLSSAGVSAAGAVLAEDPCEAAFDLVAPAEVVQARAAGLRVLVNYVDEGNCLEFLLRPESCRAIRREQGRETVLAEGRGAKGAEVVVKRRPGEFAIAYGATTVARGTVDLPPGGRWGLADGSAEELGKLWCQPVGEITFTDDFMRGPEDESLWSAVAGSWQLASLASAEFSANAFSFIGRATDRRPALAVVGDWFWEDYTVGVSVRAGAKSEGFGVGLCCQDGPSVHLLRYVKGPGRLQLVRSGGGREEVLAETSAELRPGEWHRLVLAGVAGRLAAQVDGEPALTAEDRTLAHGRIALVALGGSPVYFDDVEVYAGPPRARPATVLAHAKEVADPAAARFITDHYMEGWADESDRWAAASGPSIWHEGFFWGEVELTWTASPAALQTPAALHLCVPTEGRATLPPARFAAGYHLQLTPTEGKLALALVRGAETRASATVAAPTEEARVSWRRAGPRLEAALNGTTVASFEDDGPLPGGKVGLSGAGCASEAAHLAIRSRNVLDSTFHAAPVEWRVDGGEWGVQSRWACTPRWSWFGGRSRGLAAIRTRDRFAGDVVVDFFAANPMDSPFAPFYRHPGTIGVTLCSEGGTLDSGYSFVYGAFENRETVLLRRGQIVARTRAFTLPDVIDSFGGTLTPDAAVQLHKSWRHLHAERIGGTVRLTIDGQLALTFTDPKPLAGGPVVLWTLDNGVMIARARVYCEGRGTAGGRSQETGVATKTEAWARSVGLLPSAAPAAAPVGADLGFRPWGADAGAELRRAPMPGGGGRWCVEVRNGRLGGLFGVEAACTPFEASRCPMVSFDYCAPGTLRVDLIVELAGSRRTVKFADNDETWPVIGRIGAVADGKWHHAQVDLGAMLRRAFPGRRSLPVTRLAFASSGWPGNREGATYRIANFALSGGGAARGEDRTPPVVSQLTPAPGQAAATREISAVIADAGSGVSPADLRLKVGETTYSLADECLRYDETAARLTWTAPGRAPLGRDGQEVGCTLWAGDVAGNGLPEPKRWSWRLDYRKDDHAPSAPVVSCFPSRALFADTFEQGKGEWGDFYGCQVLRRNTGGASGPGCVELRALSPPTAGYALVRDFGSEWLRFPRLRLQYRLLNAAPASVALQGTTFDGQEDGWTTLATLPASGEGWQTVTVDLAKALQAADPKLTMHRIFLTVSSPQRDGAILIDDASMYSPESTGLRFVWGEPADATGIRGYSWLLDHEDGAVPPEQLRTTARELTFRDLGPGRWCFHLRACDGAGHWGPTTTVTEDLAAKAAG